VNSEALVEPLNDLCLAAGNQWASRATPIRIVTAPVQPAPAWVSTIQQSRLFGMFLARAMMLE
jgi:hypothetical protein